MKRFLRLIIVLAFLSGNVTVKADQYVTVAPKFEWNNDTAWYVNPEFFRPVDSLFEISLVFPSINDMQYKYARVVWGDGKYSDTWDPNTTITHHYVYKEGIFDLQVLLYNNTDTLYTSSQKDPAMDTVLCKVFNKELYIEFDIIGENKNNCIPAEKEQDTLYLVVTDFINPPGTKIDVTTTLNGNTVADDVLEYEEHLPDTIYMIFKKPSGKENSYETKVHLTLKYDDPNVPGSVWTLKSPELPGKPFQLFQAPDLVYIFSFPEIYPSPDVNNPNTLSNFEICAPNPPSKFGFDAFKESLYQTTPNNPSFLNRRNMEVDYYYTDDTTTSPNPITWKLVSSDSAYVDSVGMVFRKPGFYKIFITAMNACSNNVRDTLRTEVVRDSAGAIIYEKKYIQVAQHSEEKLGFKSDTLLCLDELDALVFVDRNERIKFDQIPVYGWEAYDAQNDTLYKDNAPWYSLVEVVHYKGGLIVNGDEGVDSTILKIKPKVSGKLAISFSRDIGACDKITQTYSVSIGNIPEFTAKDVLKDYFLAQPNLTAASDTSYFDHCGEYTFHYPDFRSDVFDNFLSLDSLGFNIRIGSKDTIVKDLGNLPGHFLFDSVGNKVNYIEPMARNKCGWAKAEKVALYTRVKPDVEIYRDGVNNNDTLCTFTPYKYHVVGTLPENTEAWFCFENPVYHNNTYISNDGSYRRFDPNTSVFEYRFQISQGAERFIIYNGNANSCSDTVVYNNLRTFTTPSLDLLHETVFYCNDLTTIPIQSVVKDPSYLKATWILGSDTVRTGQDALRPDIPVTPPQRDTLYVEISQGGGCYVKDSVLFKPVDAPVLTLTVHEKVYCLETSPEQLDIRSFINTSNENVAGNKLKVQWINPGFSPMDINPDGNYSLYPNNTYPPHIYLKYILENDSVISGISNCAVMDSVKVKIYKPDITFVYKDTFNYVPANPYYDFAHYAAKPSPNLRDTAGLDHTTYTWKIKEGYGSLQQKTPFNNPIWDWKYQYNPTQDNSLDSLVFELSAFTVCGVEKKDELVVKIAKSQFYTFEDTICNNTEEYTLWGNGKMSGDYIDTSTLKWRVIPGDPAKKWGSVIPSSGGSAKYYSDSDNKLEPGDVIKIEIQGAYNSTNIPVVDTLLLIVNPAPEYSHTFNITDTLVTDNGFIYLRQIDGLTFKYTTDTTFYDPIGLQIANDPRILAFSGANPNNSINYYGTTRIRMKGLKGCADVISEPVNFEFPVNVSPTFKNNLVACAGSPLLLEDILDVSGEDRHTSYVWDIISGPGSFDLDTTTFVTQTGDHGNTHIGVAVSKSYRTYTGQNVNGRISGTTNSTIRVYAEPQITVLNSLVNLCSSYNTYNPDWSTVISVTPSVYFDSLRVDGMKLGELPITIPPDSYDTLRFTVETGTCWANVKDSIIIYKMETLFTGDFLVNDRCEFSPEDFVNSSGLNIVNSSATYYWTSYGLDLDTAGKGLSPVYKELPGFTGEASITLHVSAGMGCDDTIRKVIKIFEKPVADFDFPVKSINQAKLNETFDFVRTAPTSGLSVSDWYIDGALTGSGERLSHTFTTETQTNIELRVETTDGCRDTTDYTIRIVAPPVIDIDADVEYCTGKVTFINRSDYNYAVIHRWDFTEGPLKTGEPNFSDDSLPAPVYYERVFGDTVFNVYLTVGNAADTIVDSVQIRLVSLLEAEIEVKPEKEGCSQIERYIENKTVGDVDRITIDWGDGYQEVFTDNLKMFSHRYVNNSQQVESYEIVFVAENQCAVSRDTVQISIFPTGVMADILLDSSPKYSSKCFGHDVGFKNSSIGFGNTGFKATWMFPQDSSVIVYTQKDTTIEYMFPDPGVYEVKLVVEDRCNIDTASMNVTIRGSKDLAIKVQSPPYCENVPVEMEAVTSTAFTNFNWKYGDGNSDPGKNVSHLYAANLNPGYYISLRASYDGCQTDATPVNIAINHAPVADVSFQPAIDNCSPLSIHFEAKNLNSANTFNSTVYWDFGNGSTSSATEDDILYSIDPLYGKDSTFKVMLRMTSQEGCISRDSATIPVGYTPKPDFVLAKDLYCTTDYQFTIDITNKTVLKDLNTYKWFVNDREFSSLADPLSHQETGAGHFEVKLRATNINNGCKDSVSLEVVSSDMLNADFGFSVQNLCEATSAQIVFEKEPGVSFKWDMGDHIGLFEENNDFNYTYDEVGDYIIEMVATNVDQCKDTVRKTVTVYPLPTAGFSWEKDFSVWEGYPSEAQITQVENGGVRFTNESFIGRSTWGEQLYYFWDFGDSTGISKEKDPTHEYKSGGMFTVNLTAITEFGCIDSTFSVVELNHLKGLFVPTAMAPSMADPGVALFLPKGTGLLSYKLQIYDTWGKFLWSTSALSTHGEPVEGWDGRVDGVEMPKGTYTWEINAVFRNGEVWSKNGKTSGTFILLR